MNFEALKSGFKDYLIQQEAKKTGKSEAQVELEEMSVFDTNILLHGEEFKQYLTQEMGQDVSIFSKSIDEIMDMQFVDGKLVDKNDPNNNVDEQKLEEAQSLQDEITQAQEEENSNSEEFSYEEFEEGLKDWVSDDMNALLNDEDFASELDTDSTGDLSKEEVNSYFNSIDTNKDKNMSFDELSNGFTSTQEQSQIPESQGNILNRVLDNIYEDADVIKALDVDGDGKLNDEERAKFEKYITGYSNDGEELSEADIKRAYDDIKAGDFSYDNNLKLKSRLIDTKEALEARKAEREARAQERAANRSSRTDKSSSSNRSSSSGSAGSSGRSGGSSGAGGASHYSSFSGSSSGAEESYDNMSLEKLKQEKETKSAEIKEANTDVSQATTDQNPAVQSANEQCDTAEEQYEKVVEENEDISDELKEQKEENNAQIEEQQNSILNIKTEIGNEENSISSLEASISTSEANVSSLESQKSSLESFQSDDKEKAEQAKSAVEALNSQIEALKAQIEQQKAELEQHKTNLNNFKDELAQGEEALGELQEQQSSIDEQIVEAAGENAEQVQEALEAINTAKNEVYETKTEQLEQAQEVLKTKQEELNEIDTQISIKENEEVKNENSVNDFDFGFNENLTDQQRTSLENFKQNFEQNKDKYKAVEQATGIPAELVAAIHWRESGGNFGTYLHNGQELGKTTTIVPKGIYFDNWTDAAIDAMSHYSTGANSVDKDDINSYYEYAERYNGLGYRKRGVASPYVWSGTDKYTGGKYVADGKFDPSAMDKQLGVAVMLKAIMS